MFLFCFIVMRSFKKTAYVLRSVENPRDLTSYIPKSLSENVIFFINIVFHKKLQTIFSAQKSKSFTSLSVQLCSQKEGWSWG